MSEMAEDFSNLCNPKTFNMILENLGFYEAQGNTRAIQLFQSLRQEAIKKCGIIIRNIDQRRYNGGQAKENKLRTVIGYEQYEINENGSLSLPQPKAEQPKVPDPIPECMLALYKNEQERKKKE